MERSKLNKPVGLIHGMLCCMVALLLCWTATLSVGVAYGRYCKSITGTMAFTASTKPQVWVMGPRDVYKIGTELPTVWKQSGNTTYVRSVSLCVSNSDPNGTVYPEEEIAVRIRLYLPEGNYSAMSLTLQIEGESQIYTAGEGTYLSQSSPLGKEKNAGGWIYTFHEPTGEELIRVLPGGKLSDINLTLIASDVSTALEDYQLLVDIIHTDPSTNLTDERKGD